MMLAVCLLAALVTVVPLATGGFGQARAVPARSADQLLERYKQLGTEAEKTTERCTTPRSSTTSSARSWPGAKKAAIDAQRKLDISREQLAAYQSRVDAIVRASYQGARVSGLYAVMVSDSPQALLDQMSGLDMISRQAASDLTAIKKVRARTAVAKKDADQTAPRGVGGGLARRTSPRKPPDQAGRPADAGDPDPRDLPVDDRQAARRPARPEVRLRPADRPPPGHRCRTRRRPGCADPYR